MCKISRFKLLNNSGPYSFVYGLIFIAALLILYGFMYIIDDMLPPALTIAQEKNYTERFIAERAQNDLKELVAIGPRVTGTHENEVSTINFLKKKIFEIQNEAHKNHVIKSDLQTVSNFYLNNERLNVYQNIQNIVVKLHAENYTDYSILINVHFDTVENSPGGSDDGINCAVGLEVLRKLSKSSRPLKYNIIFLFNGAKEQGRLGAHGFITQHKWAKEVKIVINLESVGSGGKSLLVETGLKQPWLFKYYSKVRHPFAQVIGEEIYRQNLLPFDTDYSTFTSFHNITGYNFVFIKGHYRYHSKFDNFESIPLGSYQHIGDITLDLVKYLATASEINDDNDLEENCIFFDVWGVYFIFYTERNAVIINVITSIFSVLVNVASFYRFNLKFSKKYVKHFAMAILGILSAWILPLVYVLIIGSFLRGVGFARSWNNNMWIIVGLYIIPILGMSCGVTSLFGYFKIKEIGIERHTQILIHLQRLLWTVYLLIGTSLNVRSVYLIEISVFCQTACFAIVHLTFLHRSEKVWLYIYFLTTLTSTSLLMNHSYLLGSVFLILSKSETDIEIYAILATWVFTILVTSAYIPLIHLIKKSFIPIGALLGIHLIFVIIVFTPLGNPYSSDSNSPARNPFMFNLIINKQHGINGDVINNNIALEIVRKNRNKWTSESVTDLDLSNINNLITSDSIFKIEMTKNQLDSQINFNFTFTLPKTAILYFNTEENTYINKIKFSTKQEIQCKKNSYTIKYVRGVREALNLCLTATVPQDWNHSVIELEASTQLQYNISLITLPYYKKYFDHYRNKTDAISMYIIEKWVL